MTKTATKEAEPALFTMKDVTPAKGAAQKQEPEKKPAKDKKAPSTAVAKAEPQRAVAKAEPKEPASMLAVIARAAADPRCNPENMRMMLDMQKEIVAEEARMAFNEDFIAMQLDLPVINAKGRIEILKKGSDGQRIKGRDPVEQSTPYATFNEMNRITKPILQKHRFALSFLTDQGTDGRLIVKGVLKHIRGHQETTTLSLPLETSGSKNNVQGFGSSMSYGKRYATIALLNLVSEAMEDRDDDGTAAGGGNEERVPDQPKRLTLNQCESLTAMMKTCKVSIENFCERYGIAAVIDLNPAMLQEAEKALRAHAKKNGIELPEPK